jgi:hypothetical protein
MIPATVSRRGGGVLLDIALTLPSSIHLYGEDWPAKNEFHVTLFSRDSVLPEIIVKRAADSIDFAVTLHDEYWRLVEGDARTIVQMCTVSGAEEFFLEVERDMGAAIPRRPFHVTLFAINTGKGIGLASRDELSALGSRIEGTHHLALVRQLGGANA